MLGTQGRNIVTGEWRVNTATATIANASMDSARRGMAAVKDTRNEKQAGELRNTAKDL